MKTKEEWLNSKWSAQNKLAAHEDPAVYASVILSEKKVMLAPYSYFNSVISFSPSVAQSSPNKFEKVHFDKAIEGSDCVT